jgi:hypothetical protein
MFSLSSGGERVGVRASVEPTFPESGRMKMVFGLPSPGLLPRGEGIALRGAGKIRVFVAIAARPRFVQGPADLPRAEYVLPPWVRASIHASRIASPDQLRKVFEMPLSGGFDVVLFDVGFQPFSVNGQL